MNKLTTTFILIMLGTSANAEEFNYDYAQVGIGTSNYKSYDKEYYVEASKSINDNIAVIGGLGYTYGDWNDPGEYEEQRANIYYLEGVYHKDITPTTDLVASAQYLRFDYRRSCTPTSGSCGVYADSTPSYDFYIANLGARHKVTDDIEVEGQYKYIKRDGGNVINRQAKLDLVKAVTKTISVGAEYTWDLNKAAVNVKVNHYGVFVRRSF
jgi:hypothetical protein